MHFARTSYRSSSPMGRGQANDLFAPLFQSISIFEGAASANAVVQGRPQARNIRAIQHPTHTHRPEFASQNPFPNHQHHHIHHHHGPWIPGSGPPGGRQAFTATSRIWPRNGPNAPPNDRTINNLHRSVDVSFPYFQTNRPQRTRHDATINASQHGGPSWG